MATYNLITDPIKLNEFRFYRENPAARPLFATKPFDGWSLEQTRLWWMMKSTFMHKKLFNDICTVYIQTQANFPGSALPYPDLQLLNWNKEFVADLSVLPFIKGAQQVSGQVVYNEFTDAEEQANTYCWEFKMQDLLPADQSGIYYLRLVNLAADGESYKNYITEPIFVFGNDAQKTFPETVLIASYNNSNNDYMGYLRGGWDDPNYYPIFRRRVDGYLTEFEPKSVYIGMLEQEYQPNKILAQNYRSWKLDLGGNGSRGITPYEHEGVNEQLSCDMFFIDGNRYERDITDTDAGVKALWQSSKPQTTQRRRVTTMLREDKNWRYTLQDQVTNPCVCPTLVSVIITKTGPTYYALYRFSLPDGVTCGFTIYTTSHFPGGSFTDTTNIASTSDLVSVGGGEYTKQVVVGGYPDISYAINKTSSGVNCYAGEATYDCDAPEYTIDAYTSEGVDYIRIITGAEGCGELSVSYNEVYSPADSGSYTFDTSNPQDLHVISPKRLCGAVKYNVIITDCCGNVNYHELDYGVIAGPGPTIISGSLSFSGGQYKLNLNFSDCGTCHKVLVTGYQLNVPGAPDTINSIFYVPCDEGFPYTESIVLDPVLVGLSPSTVQYRITITSCCETAFGPFNTNSIPV